MTRRNIIMYSCFLLSAVLCRAQEHTRFLDISLDVTPDSMMQELCHRGLQQEGDWELSGRIAGLDVWLTLNVKDSVHINHICLSTQHIQGRSQHDDYKTLMRWLRHHYGEPSWESEVRGHSFSRWFVDFDRDIVLIATSHDAVEVWFYETHLKRHYDYYAILKYCERNPSDDVPFLTARECVTWKDSVQRPVIKKVAKGRKVKKGRRTLRRYAKAKRSRAKSRSRRRRR